MGVPTFIPCSLINFKISFSSMKIKPPALPVKTISIPVHFLDTLARQANTNNTTIAMAAIDHNTFTNMFFQLLMLFCV